ncbi:MAG: DUF4910 domain-containing protein [Prochlorococcus marinus XMU1428]|nr:DUF4910 domain-containing protein [Prochlorococcus marinus XMU1428]
MIGKEIHNFALDLWKINRSITGEGVRETLSLIKEHLPNLKVHSVKSGTKVFDWELPQEWKVNKAYIITPDGKKICDYSENNLHLIGYSTPFNGYVSFEELKNHLHTLPKQPKAIPYITSYYKPRWGFSISTEEYLKLGDGMYEVIIDTELFDGYLNYGELIIPGNSKKEVFLSSYICHPSMANNELSGPTVLTFLSKWLENLSFRNYTYRIVFIPETIGSISYLSSNYREMKKNVFSGFNITCVGDNRAYSFLPSRKGNTISDFVAKHVLRWIDPNYKIYTWLDRGSDERQYCAPGVDLPIASIMRTKYGEYPEYHTSLDDLKKVVTPFGLNGGYWALRRAIEVIEKNKKFKVNILCEPQMGKRGLYPTLSTKDINEKVNLMMDFISLCDGEEDLLSIAEILNVPIWNLYELSEKLIKENIISEF